MNCYVAILNLFMRVPQKGHERRTETFAIHSCQFDEKIIAASLEYVVVFPFKSERAGRHRLNPFSSKEGYP